VPAEHAWQTTRPQSRQWCRRFVRWKGELHERTEQEDAISSACQRCLASWRAGPSRRTREFSSASLSLSKAESDAESWRKASSSWCLWMLGGALLREAGDASAGDASKRVWDSSGDSGSDIDEDVSSRGAWVAFSVPCVPTS